MKSSNFVILEDTIIEQNIKYENIKPKGTIIMDSYGKILKAFDETTSKYYCVRAISINQDNLEETIKSEINFYEKTCKFYYKPKSFPTYFGYVKLAISEERQFLLFFNYKKNNLLDYLLLKEKNKQSFPLQDLVKFYDSVVNGMAFCQSLNIIPKEFSSQYLLCDIDQQNNPLISFLNLTHVEFLNEFKKPINFNTKNDDILAPELHNLLKSTKKINYYKAEVFSLAILIIRMGLGYPLFEENPNFYLNLVNDEENFENEFNFLLEKLEKNYEKQEKSKFLLFKLINDLKIMVNFDPEKRPDFLDLFRKNIDLYDLEKVKSHILISEGLTFPSIERYDVLEPKTSISMNDKEIEFDDKIFELNSMDKNVKIIGIGAAQIKQNFDDEMFIYIIYTINFII